MIWLWTGAYHDGRAVVQSRDGFGVIDEDGNVVVEPKYTYIDVFNEGVAVVRMGDMYGYIDLDGNEVLAPLYKFATRFNDGKGTVSDWNEQSFMVDADGNQVSRKYRHIGSFNKGVAYAKDEVTGLYCIIDIHDHRITPFIYQEVQNYEYGTIGVYRVYPYMFGHIDRYGMIQGNYR